MLILKDNTELLTLVLTGAVAVNELVYTVDGGGGKVGVSAGTSPVTLMAGAEKSPVKVNSVTVHNPDTGNLTFILRHKVSSTNYQIGKYTLPSLATLVSSDEGVVVTDSNGKQLVNDTATVSAGAGAAAGGATVVAQEEGNITRRTTLTLTDLLVTVTDALAYASQKVYDFPAGRILVHGVTANLRFGVTGVRADTINDNAALKFAIGSVAASNATLSSTMVDMLPKTSKTLDGAVAAYTSLIGAALAASAQFDGTATAIDAILNLAFETGGDIDADGQLKISGTITFTWSNLGDY